MDVLRNSPLATIIFKNTVTQEGVDALIYAINKIEGVKEIEFISKEDALKIYQEENKDDPLLLELVTADVLPESLRVYSYELPTVEQRNLLKSLIKDNPNIERVVMPNINYY